MDAHALKLLQEIYTPIRASMYRSVNQTGIVTATVTAVQFDTSEYDNASIITNINTANVAFTIPQAGWYLVTGCVSFQANAANSAVASYMGKNASASTSLEFGDFLPQTNAGGTFLGAQCNGIFEFQPGDTVTFSGAQNSGSNGIILGGSTRTWARIILLQEGAS